MARHPRWLRRLLTPADLDTIADAVHAAEAGTSGEIRVHLDAACAGDPMRRAVEVFERLGMHRTAQRNGVLIYLAIEDRRLAVIGDEGIHAHVPGDYWERVARALVAHLKDGRLRDGVVAAVRELGEVLRRHFPRGRADRDELSDEVSLG